MVQPTVLVVDDNPIALQLMRAALVESGYAVVVAHDVMRALAAVQRVQPHVVLTDIQLPDGDGAMVVAAVRAQVPQVRAIGLSPDPAVVARAVADGFDELALKPLPGDLAVQLVARWVPPPRTTAPAPPPFDFAAAAIQAAATSSQRSELAQLQRHAGSLELEMARRQQALDAFGEVHDALRRSHEALQRTNAELRAQAERHEAVVRLCHIALARPPLLALFHDAAELARTTLGAQLGHVFLVEREGTAMGLCAGRGWPAPVSAGLTVPLPLRSVQMAALHAQTGVAVDDWRAEDRFDQGLLFREHGVRATLVAGIRMGLEPVGVLAVAERDERAWTPAEAGFVQALADVMGGAIAADR